jgi:acylglycerol lipase
MPSLSHSAFLAGLCMRVALAVVLAHSVACAPLSQQALRPAVPVSPAFTQDRFISFDGAQLGLTQWVPPEGGEPWAVIVALHGMGDYAAAFAWIGPWFAQQGVAVYAYDQRGHGRSPQRGVWGGETLLLEDLRTAVRLAQARHPQATIAVLGESMGAAVAMSAFGSDAPPAADRLVLCAPAVWGWSSLPRTYAVTLWLGAHTLPARPVSAPRQVQRRITPSDNREALIAMGRDPLMIFETRIDAIYGLVSLMERASDSGASLALPTAFLYGAHDDIIPGPAAVRAAQLLPASARTALYANGYHLLLRDHQRAIVGGDIVAFLRDPQAPFPSGAPALPASWPPPRND